MHGKARTISAVAAATISVVLLASCSSGAGTKAGKATATSASPTAAPAATGTPGPGKQARSEFLSFPEPGRTWKELPDTGGVKYANVRGDLAGSGDYEAFVSFPAGKDNPEHHHKQELPTVVLKGTFYAEFDGKRVRYPAGSYYSLPADRPHLSGCEKGEDCLLFQYQRDHFDLIPTRTG
ncbi:cupin domain-containing protein [Streptomyces sp. NBC_00249]|uniref:cupin domain-containing protein n=1 Tax=Streptomyces sp. NBC_00249 TaxID=2975690 RepID=UPI00225360E6|nr:cupin domain-containing protein [Streptomyces sp. NBC_00249]MCX5192417.1 cupin domain-containing protein [Streptomyces sp. NBC_00249]